MSEYSCPFIKQFDGVGVPLIFNDMVLWVGADEALKILKISSHALHTIPESEKASLSKLQPCSAENNKLYLTALGVAALVLRQVSRGCAVNDCITNDQSLPERANAFANIFLTDVIAEIRIGRLMCAISKKEDEIINLLSGPSFE
jgi:Baculovirus polyhedron envelope protein, PEP, N terminus